jgi:type IV pilus assembly protein PilW
MTRRARFSRTRGFTLLELMLAVTIGLLVVASSIGIFLNIKLSLLSQDAQAQVQDAQRQAITLLRTTIQSAGYFVNPTLATRDEALPASTSANADGTTFLAAQSIVGADVPVGKSVQASVNLRFQTASGDGVMNCRGETNTSGAPVLYVNSLTVNANNELTCSVNGAAAVPVLSNVSSMSVRYGVDTDTPAQFSANPGVDTYLSAAKVTEKKLWGQVLTVEVKLVFINSSTPTLTRPWVQLIHLPNHV